MRLGEIVLFGWVCFEVEKLGGVVFKILEQFVISQTDCAAGALHAVIAVVGEVPVYCFSVEGLAFECGGEAYAVEVLVGHGGQRRHLEDGRIEIRADDGFGADGAGGSVVGPLYDHRYADAAFV